MVVGVLIATAISFLFGFIAQAIFNWFNGVYDIIYFFTNTPFIAIAILIMFFVKKMIEVYMAWSNGDPEVSPMTVVVGFVKALIIMICFRFYLYTICLDLL